MTWLELDILLLAFVPRSRDLEADVSSERLAVHWSLILEGAGHHLPMDGKRGCSGLLEGEPRG